MSAIVDSFFPLLALIFLGWFVRRRNLMRPGAAPELTAFVVWLALPALLFEGISSASLRQLWQWQFVVSYAGAMVLTFLATFWCLPRAQPFADRCLDSFGATYANSGFIGIPLSVLLLGREALIPATIATLLTAVLLFAVGIVLLELGGGGASSAAPLASVAKALRAVARNPLVVATMLGGAWSATGRTMPDVPHRLLALLSGAAGPYALVSIGALLALPAPAGAPSTPMAPVIVAKLVVLPAICALLAISVFHLPPVWATTAVLLDALPTATGPFMLAEFYQREVARASRIMFVTTMLSLVNVPVCIVLLR